jgi:hypothetical protein
MKLFRLPDGRADYYPTKQQVINCPNPIEEIKPGGF